MNRNLNPNPNPSKKGKKWAKAILWETSPIMKILAFLLSFVLFF